jgi:hypothetical protein
MALPPVVLLFILPVFYYMPWKTGCKEEEEKLPRMLVLSAFESRWVLFAHENGLLFSA